jgi:hypothetical protein
LSLLYYEFPQAPRRKKFGKNDFHTLQGTTFHPAFCKHLMQANPAVAGFLDVVYVLDVLVVSATAAAFHFAVAGFPAAPVS